jgi:hypothetical protein
MLIGVMGKMGAGKTLSCSILASFLHARTGAPLSANYGLRGSDPIESLDDVEEKEGGIMVFDEVWLSADARAWKDNVKLTHWVNQTRKKKMIVFYTTQHIRQVEMRMRNGTDVLIYVEKKPEGHWLTFIDFQYKTIGRRYLIPHEVAKNFYGLYDTYEVLKPLTWGKKKGKPWNAYETTKSYDRRPYKKKQSSYRYEPSSVEDEE